MSSFSFPIQVNKKVLDLFSSEYGNMDQGMQPIYLMTVLWLALLSAAGIITLYGDDSL